METTPALTKTNLQGSPVASPITPLLLALTLSAAGESATKLAERFRDGRREMRVSRWLVLLAVASGLLAGVLRAGADTLFVANSGNNQVIKIDTSGNKTTFASSGLSYPTGLAFDSEGNLYVSDFDNNRVMKYDPQGNASVFATGLNGPSGLAFDSAGNLYVANYLDDTIMKLATNGATSLFADSSKGLNWPGGLACGPDGTLYIANEDNIEKITPDGTNHLLARMVDTPNGLVFHGGLLFTTSLYDAGVILTVDPTNGVVMTWAVMHQPPNGLAFDRSDNLFIACQDNVIRKIVDGSRTTTIFASGLNYPQFIAFKPPPILHARSQTNGVVLSWNDNSFALQAAPTPNSTFTNVSGASSPWTNTIVGGAAFFRLKGN